MRLVSSVLWFVCLHICPSSPVWKTPIILHWIGWGDDHGFFSKSFENGPNTRHMLFWFKKQFQKCIPFWKWFSSQNTVCMVLDAISESQNYHPTLIEMDRRLLISINQSIHEIHEYETCNLFLYFLCLQQSNFVLKLNEELEILAKTILIA